MTFDWHTFTEALVSGTFFRGALLSLALAISSMIAATVLGLRSRCCASLKPGARAAGWTYVWFFRAIPTC